MIFLVLPLKSDCQDWKSTQQNFIKELTIRRAKLMVENEKGVFELKELIENWNAKESDPERIKNLIFQIQHGVKVLGFSCKRLQKKLKKTYPGFVLAEEFSEKEYETLIRNSDLIDLITGSVLKPKYPFQLDSKSLVFKELKFYEFKQNETVGEIGAGNGMFSSLLSLLDVDLTLFVNEVDYTKISFLRKNMFTNFAANRSSKITIVKGKKSKTKFLPASLDKIIIRNSFHHFSKKEAMLASIKEALKPNGVLFLNEPIKSDKGCKKRMEKPEIKEILQQNGFKLEKEMNIEGVLLLKYFKN